MKNGGRITASDDKDHMDAASWKLWRRDKNGELERIPDPLGKYAKLRPSKYSNPDLNEQAVTAPSKKQAVVEGAPQCIPGLPGVTKKYSGRKLPSVSEVVRAVEDDSVLRRARKLQEKTKR
jgi:hypothetical protein